MFIIRIDPHKGSHTAVVVDCREAVVATIRVDADRHQRDRLVEWAARSRAAHLGGRAHRSASRLLFGHAACGFDERREERPLKVRPFVDEVAAIEARCVRDA